MDRYRRRGLLAGLFFFVSLLGRGFRGSVRLCSARPARAGGPLPRGVGGRGCGFSAPNDAIGSPR